MYERIRTYLSQQLDIHAEEMSRDTSFESLHLDSLDMVEMIMDMEEELFLAKNVHKKYIDRWKRL